MSPYLALKLLIKLRSVKLQKARADTTEAEENYGGEDKYRTVHKEVLWEYHNDSVGIGVENPVILTGEENLVENGKGSIEIQ